MAVPPFRRRAALGHRPDRLRQTGGASASPTDGQLCTVHCELCTDLTVSNAKPVTDVTGCGNPYSPCTHHPLCKKDGGTDRHVAALLAMTRAFDLCAGTERGRVSLDPSVGNTLGRSAVTQEGSVRTQARPPSANERSKHLPYGRATVHCAL